MSFLPDVTPADLYLDLMKRTLTRLVDTYEYRPARRLKPLQRVLARRDVMLLKRVPINRDIRRDGKDWPEQAETMIGLRRLDQLEEAVRDVVRAGIPGDLVETGVWRGGATIFMRACLEAYGDPDRLVWACDSFEGLPRPTRSEDEGDPHWTFSHLAVGLEQVRDNFRRYGLLDDRVKFLAGWFKDTLPSAPIDRIAVLRLDGDMYESTIDALTFLYPKLSIGGYCIIDDYHLEGCRRAVHDYRDSHGIRESIVEIDDMGVYWIKSHVASDERPSPSRLPRDPPGSPP